MVRGDVPEKGTPVCRDNDKVNCWYVPSGIALIVSAELGGAFTAAGILGHRNRPAATTSEKRLPTG